MTHEEATTSTLLGPTRHLPARIKREERPLPEGIVAASDEMRELISVIRAVAPTEITVLLLGESGTGKEVLARLIHDFSSRAHGPFVTVNCGAIPEGLIESELFGHEKGSFTGAHVQRKGFFEAAHGGTIFLDEIGEMPLSLQVKLLRVLETGTFSRVGSSSTLTSDARVVAATNRDLEIEVRSGNFRADLYYRLRAVMLRIPPLRNRREDIPFLIEVMLAEFVKKHRLLQMPRIESSAIHLLLEHEWRGNVRELRNTIEQLVVLGGIGKPDGEGLTITYDAVEKILAESETVRLDQSRHLPVAMLHPPQEQSERELIYRALLELKNEIRDIKGMLADHPHDASPSSGAAHLPALPSPSPHPNNVIKSLDAIERDALHNALEHFRGNRREAASALGISERTLYRKLKEQGLDHGH